MNFKNKTVIVTGANKGIGRAVALYFFNQEANVVFAVRDPKKMELPKKIVESPRVLIVKVDVLNIKEIQIMVKKAVKKFKNIDCLVNNAGVDQPCSLFDLTEEHLDYIMDTNFKGAVFCSKFVAAEMIKRRQGNIINLSSIAGKEGTINHLAYVSSKHAVLGLTKSLAKELIQYNIRVNAVCPGLIDTDMLRSFFRNYAKQIGSKPDLEIKKMLSQTPSGRMGQPEDVAKLIGFLASDDSKNIIGQAINTDGGMQQH